MRLIILVLCIMGTAAAAEDFSSIVEDAKRRCAPPLEGEPFLTNSDFPWKISANEALRRAEEIYESGKRLQGRAYYEASTDQFILTLNRSENNRVVMPPRLVATVKKHIESALERDYAQVITFADMGHSHFLIPTEDYERDIAPIPASEQNRSYELMLNNPNLKILYHTAEQLLLRDEHDQLHPEEFYRWRYYTRNLVGDNKALGQMEIHKNFERNYNTVGTVEGYKWWGGGFYVNISKNGCFFFEHKGKKLYFDLSFFSIPVSSDEETSPFSNSLNE